MFDLDKVDRGVEMFIFNIYVAILKIEPNLKQELIEAFIKDNSYLDFIVKQLEYLRGKNE